MHEGRLLWLGDLNNENIDACADAIAKVLNGKAFTWIAAYEYKGFRPESRQHMRLRQDVTVQRHEHDGRQYSAIRLDDDDTVTSLSPGYSKDRPTHVVVHERSVEVHQWAGNGKTMWWLWQPEPDVYDDEGNKILVNGMPIPVEAPT